MIARLFSRPRARVAAPSIPPGRRVYAIGDIHGRDDLFEALLDMIDRDDAARPDAETTLVLLGDLVDRGRNSAAVVARAKALAESGRDVRFLMGNHEEVFLRVLDGDARVAKLFVRIGGDATALSYGISHADYAAMTFDELAAELTAKVPSDHRAFLSRFEDQIVIGDYLFVHAGIRPGVAFEEQKPADLRWIRDEFLDHRGEYGAVVVHGHSISDEVEARSNRIGIDTGAFASGRLTALGLEGTERWYFQTEP